MWSGYLIIHDKRNISNLRLEVGISSAEPQQLLISVSFIQCNYVEDNYKMHKINIVLVQNQLGFTFIQSFSSY